MNVKLTFSKIILLSIIILIMSQFTACSMANITSGAACDNLNRTDRGPEGKLNFIDNYEITPQDSEKGFSISDDTQSRTYISCNHRVNNLISCHLQNSSYMYTVTSAGYNDDNRYWVIVYNHSDDTVNINIPDDSNMNIVPVPGAILLGSIGISIFSWLRCRGKL